MPTFSYERRIGGLVAGVDEAGRGPLAGPVVAAAVVFKGFTLPRALSGRIDDSKKIAAEDRESTFTTLRRLAQRGDILIGVGAASVEEIDRINILQATFAAMRRAVARLPSTPDAALVDGNLAPPNLGCRAETLVDGDARSLSIAAASIVAKVLRDRAMVRLSARYAGFGWQTNVGYSTPEHIEALGRLGPTKHHRLSFSPCAQTSLPL
ncbi:MAG TPA: ribonuclease HII [Alphaproteobacteria bacterium]|nr:ribonuclease HII [Alphaproteobacteria bacterium]